MHLTVIFSFRSLSYPGNKEHSKFRNPQSEIRNLQYKLGIPGDFSASYPGPIQGDFPSNTQQASGASTYSRRVRERQ